MTTIINLTPHAVVIAAPSETMMIPSSGVARVGTSPSFDMSPINGIPVVSSPSATGVVGLPPPLADRVYIVSGMVLAQCKGRTDVFAPGTGPNDGAIRNDAGQIVAVTRLIAAPQ